MKLVKKLVLTALIVIGILAVGAFSALAYSGFDVHDLDRQNYKETVNTVTDEVSTVAIDVRSFDVKIIPTDGEDIKVVGLDGNDVTTAVSASEGTLHIKTTDSRSWYQRLVGGIGRDRFITVYIPSSADVSLDVTLDLGDAEILGVKLPHVSVKTDDGDVEIKGGEIGKLSVTTSCGGVDLASLALGELYVKTEKGDVDLELLTAGIINVETKSGDVEGELHGAHNYSITSERGKVRTPASDPSGAPVNVKTKSGKVYFNFDD